MYREGAYIGLSEGEYREVWHRFERGVMDAMRGVP